MTEKQRIEINSYYGNIYIRAFSDGKKYAIERTTLMSFLEKKLKKGEYTLEEGKDKRTLPRINFS